MKIRQDGTHDTVYFSDMMLYVLSKWRSLLIVAAVVALMLGAYSYVKSSKEVSEAEHLAGINVEEGIKNSTDEVRNVAEYQTQLQEFKKYIDNGMVMNMDSVSVSRVTLNYYVDGNPGEETVSDVKDMRTNALVQAYMSKATGEKVRSNVVESFDGKIAQSDLNYLLTVTDTDNTFSVIIKGPDDDTCTRIAGFVKAIIDESGNEFSRTVGNHVIELVDESHTFGIDTEISDAQTSINKAYSLLGDKISDSRNSLDEGGRELIDAMIFQSEDHVIGNASVSKKYIVMGAILGLLIVAVIHMIRYAYTAKVVTADQVYRTCKAPVIGELTVGYGRMHTAIDRKIYRKLFGIKGNTDTDRQIDYISAGIVNICKARNAESLYVVNGADESDLLKDCLNRILKKVSENGIKAESGYDDGCNADVVSGIAGADAVVIMAGLFSTDLAILSNQVAMCMQQNKQIIGSIVAVK